MAAVKKGYSKRLRHWARTQRVSVGFIDELIEDAVTVVLSAEQKADIFTKALLAAPFSKARDAVNVGVG